MSDWLAPHAGIPPLLTKVMAFDPRSQEWRMVMIARPFEDSDLYIIRDLESQETFSCEDEGILWHELPPIPEEEEDYE